MSRKIYKFKTQINSVMFLEKKGGGGGGGVFVFCVCLFGVWGVGGGGILPLSVVCWSELWIKVMVGPRRFSSFKFGRVIKSGNSWFIQLETSVNFSHN